MANKLAMLLSLMMTTYVLLFMVDISTKQILYSKSEIILNQISEQIESDGGFIDHQLVNQYTTQGYKFNISPQGKQPMYTPVNITISKEYKLLNPLLTSKQSKVVLERKVLTKKR